jgi:DNA-binding XRE family transcriptional regulator
MIPVKISIHLVEAMFAHEYGAALRKYRVERKFSQDYLGVLVGAHRNTACRWERGTTTPSVFEHYLLCEHLPGLRGWRAKT